MHHLQAPAYADYTVGLLFINPHPSLHSPLTRSLLHIPPCLGLGRTVFLSLYSLTPSHPCFPASVNPSPSLFFQKKKFRPKTDFFFCSCSKEPQESLRKSFLRENKTVSSRICLPDRTCLKTKRVVTEMPKFRRNRVYTSSLSHFSFFAFHLSNASYYSKLQRVFLFCC